MSIRLRYLIAIGNRQVTEPHTIIGEGRLEAAHAAALALLDILYRFSAMYFPTKEGGAGKCAASHSFHYQPHRRDQTWSKAMAGRNKKIDPRKAIFISEILTGKSGAEAARAAGYEKKGATRQAHRLQNDPEIKKEIEEGLATIREGAEVTAESMIRQLDADRIFAIRTANASAATRASELKAKLVGLLVERRDTRAAHFVKTDAEMEAQAMEAARDRRDLEDMLSRIAGQPKHVEKVLDELAAPEKGLSDKRPLLPTR